MSNSLLAYRFQSRMIKNKNVLDYLVDPSPTKEKPAIFHKFCLTRNSHPDGYKKVFCDLMAE